MKFILIEGDNGTGKDTLASKLEKRGMKIITYDSKIIQSEKEAKGLIGKDKVKAFIRYNYECSNYILDLRNKKFNFDCILVRYWISTLAAAYADNIFDENMVIKLAEKITREVERPDLVIRLNCNYAERINRIEKRNSNEFDDKTLARANKYKDISQKLRYITSYEWKEIDTTCLNENQVYEHVCGLLKQEKEYNERG